MWVSDLGDDLSRVAHLPSGRPVAPAHGEAEDRAQVAAMKRLIEWAYLDRETQARLLQDPAGVCSELGLDVDAEALRPVFERLNGSPPIPEPVAPEVERFRAFVHGRQDLRRRMLAGSVPRDPEWARWRERQIRRCWLELPPATAGAVTHVPVAVELNRGCSVGCWFCGVGAGPLKECASYRELAGLWREMLGALDELCGPAAAFGFLYWATDPLDNPDYEKFALDYSRAFGRFPMTTTALPLRDAERTRSLLATSVANGCELNRFSILSRGLLRRVFAEFSPEELLQVDCLPLNRESGYSVSYSGRARRGAAPGRRVNDPWEAATIACVSGFLVNLVERRVRLITPCNASDRWPLGYWVLAEDRFSDGDSFLSAMRRMIEAQDTSVPPDRPLRWHRHLRWSTDGSGSSLEGRWRTLSLGQGASVVRLGDALAEGAPDQERLVLKLEEEHGVPLAHSLFLLEQWFQSGLLCEEPAPPERADPEVAAS